MVQENTQEALAENPDIGRHNEDWHNADVVCGGFPCQDISNAGRRAGITAERSGLWAWLCGAIRLVRPKYALVENVAALLGNGMGTVLGDLAEIGYDTEWHCISAADVGSIHLRERSWIIAYDNEKREPQQKRSKQNQRGWDYNGIEACSTTDVGSQRVERIILKTIQKQPVFSWCQDVGRIEDLFGRPDIPEPLIRRIDNGLSARVDGIGNSVVPQIPEIIGRAILEAEKQ